MKSRTTIVVAYALAGLFTLFNVGLPIVMFVCPMMSDGQVCDCNSAPSEGLSISFEGANCCSHVVVAERNTMPFLGSAKYQVPAAEVVLVLSAMTMPIADPAHPEQFHYASDTGPPVSPNPIYLLSSALLI